MPYPQANPEHVDFFRRHGWLKVEDVINHYQPPGVQSDLLRYDPDESRTVVCPLKFGSVTFHHGKTPHMTTLGTIGAGGCGIPLERRLAVTAGTSACHLALVPEGQRVRGVWGPYYGALLPQRWLLQAGISASGAFLDHALRQFDSGSGTAIRSRAERAVREMEASGHTMRELTRDLHLQCNVLGNRALSCNRLPTRRATLSRRCTRRECRSSCSSCRVAARRILAGARSTPMHSASRSPCPGSRTACYSDPRCWLHATGLRPSLTIAMGEMNSIATLVHPDAAARPFHDAKYAVYRRMIEEQHAYVHLMNACG